MAAYPISIQLYSLREEAEKDFARVLEKVGEMGYAGVEPAGLHGMKPEEVRKICDDQGLVVSSIHGPLPTKDNVSEVVDTAKALGFTRHVSGFGRKHLDTDEKCLAAAEKLQAGAELLKGAGLTFGYHNHEWEFDTEFGGRRPHDILMEKAPDVFAEVDTYWVQVAGADAVEVVRELGVRAPLLHIKDGPIDRDSAMTAVGAGKMDLQAVIGAAHESTEWLVVELDRCDTDMPEAVRRSLQYLVDAGLGRGRE